MSATTESIIADIRQFSFFTGVKTAAAFFQQPRRVAQNQCPVFCAQVEKVNVVFGR